MKRSESINEIAAALSKAQAEIKLAIPNAENPHFRSSYADLGEAWETCRGPLTKNGLALCQGAESEAGKIIVTSLLMHSSGQWLESSLTLQPEKNTPQGFGSAITYGKRYLLNAMVGIAEADDDGEASEGRGEDKKPANTQPPKQVGGTQPSPLSDEEKASRKVTENQVKRLYAILGGAQRDNRWDEGSAKSFLKQASGLESFLDLNMKQYDWFCHQLEKSDYNKAMAALANIQMKKQPAPAEREPGDDSDESFQNYR